MAARAPSWIFFRTLYLKNHLSNQFEIFIIYWYPCKDVSYQISRWLEIQYGRQGANLDFLSDTISQEPFKQLIWNFYHLLVFVQEYVLPNFVPIRNPTWPQGRHLGFSFGHYISWTIWAINLKFLSFIGIRARMYPAEFRADQKSNMAAREPSWILFRTLYLGNHLCNQFEIFIIYWDPCKLGSHLGFSFGLNSSKTNWNYLSNLFENMYCTILRVCPARRSQKLWSYYRCL